MISFITQPDKTDLSVIRIIQQLFAPLPWLQKQFWCKSGFYKLNKLAFIVAKWSGKLHYRIVIFLFHTKDRNTFVSSPLSSLPFALLCLSLTRAENDIHELMNLALFLDGPRPLQRHRNHSLSAPSESHRHHSPLWSRITKNADVSTGPLAHLFARLLAPLASLMRSAALTCLLAHSLLTSWGSEWLDSYFCCVFPCSGP